MPERGIDEETLFRTMESYRESDLDSHDGRVFSYVYHAGEAAERVGKRAFQMFMGANGLDPTVFPSLLRFEREVVAMARAHLGGDERVVGTFTSGGTESILLAVKTARDAYRARRPDGPRPAMILPVTAHAAFHKAACYFDVDVVAVPVDDATFRADPAAVRAAIDERTILLVGSAPSYAHGVVDPIEELGAIALEHDLWLHVDACIGGFLLPYFRRLGDDVPPFDFTVPGVSSISMDLHKYAFAPKGASVLLMRDRELRRHQIFACAEWTGYSVVNTTMQSTKSGGPMAAAWAVMRFLGDDGYLAIARDVREATRAIVEGIRSIDGLRVLGEPDMSLIAFACDGVSPFHVVDEMSGRGWYVQAQLGFGGSPPNVHLTVGPSNVGVVDALIEDLRASVEAARALPPSGMAAMLREALSGVDPDELTGERLQHMLAMAGVSGTQLPERMADINEVLDALPPALCERLLREFMNELFA